MTRRRFQWAAALTLALAALAWQVKRLDDWGHFELVNLDDPEILP